MVEDNVWIQALSDANAILPQAQERKRKQVMNLLRLLTPTLIRHIVREEPRLKADFTCQLVPFGSCALEAHTEGSDMDFALIAPQQVKRNDFFRIYSSILREQTTVSEVNVVDHAAVPVIRCVIDRTLVDITFVRLRRNTIPPDLDYLDNKNLVELDDACFASLDGVRCTHFYQRIIRTEHKQVFSRTLQTVKWWARQRGIYDKSTGYLNSGALTILLVHVYQKLSTYPEPMTIHSLLSAFFDQWSEWPWPEPVLLTDGIPGHQGDILSYESHAFLVDALMPIVTPCYRVSNAAPCVTKSSLTVLKKEFARASDICAYSFEIPDRMPAKLFRPYRLTKSFKSFLAILVCCDTGLSRENWLLKMPRLIPRFVELLEDMRLISYVRVLPEPVMTSIPYNTNGEKTAFQYGEEPKDRALEYKISELAPGELHRTCYLMGIEFNKELEPDTDIDITQQAADFQRVITSNRGRKDDDVVVNIVGLQRSDVVRLLKE
ncbi:Poly(A) polymerase central domain-domain-containing protein [Syncephalastrum racemosum]|uniref:polynucleotide adenylyltransferase n=1 Tax=Syncephalastrum racemosum TaxID=13706 RepID=A0A1X2H1B8_SYNRA|nr:Poly(A) polymerase central domain-domain-containing protein [Syncephalastrum racemosum]